jgi:hypothetical protein
MCARSCIAEAASTVYNFKLPAIVFPDVKNLSLVPAVVTEFLQALPKPSLQASPLISIPPFSELPIVKQIMGASPNVDFWPQFLGFFYDISQFLVWITCTVPFALLNDVTNLPQCRRIFYTICRFNLNLLFGLPFQQVDQNMGSASIVWQLYFGFRYAVHLIMWPVMIILGWLWSVKTGRETTTTVLLRVWWPTLLANLKATAMHNFVYMIILIVLPSVIVSKPISPETYSATHVFLTFNRS